MKRVNVLLSVLLLLLTNCESWFVSDKEFSITPNPYLGNELKINGYYYLINSNNPDNAHIYVFYANGIQFGGGYGYDVNKIEANFIDPSYQQRINDNFRYWGVYQIQDGRLNFQFYEIFGNYWRIVEAHCKIQNDTTFNVEKISMMHTGKDISKEANVNHFLGTYHFKQFDNKPDSTNAYIP